MFNLWCGFVVMREQLLIVLGCRNFTQNGILLQIFIISGRHLHRGVVPGLLHLVAPVLALALVLLGLAVPALAGRPAVTAVAAEAETVNREQSKYVCLSQERKRP